MNEELNNKTVCPNCGLENNQNMNFCARCGANLQIQTVNQNPNISFDQPNGAANNPNMQVNPNTNLQPNNQAPANNTEGLSYFKYLVSALLKPFDTFKKEEAKLSNIKNASILSLIVIAALVVFGLLSNIITIILSVREFSGGSELVMESLKSVPYVKVIGQNLLLYSIVFLAISGVYYLASLVIKKEFSFVKMLSITATAMIPFAVVSIVGPLLSIIFSSLLLYVYAIGIIYSLVILIELVDDSINIESINIKIYFHAICLSILAIAWIIYLQKFLANSLLGLL